MFQWFRDRLSNRLIQAHFKDIYEKLNNFAENVKEDLKSLSDRTEVAHSELVRANHKITELQRLVGKPKSPPCDPDSTLWVLIDEIRTSMRVADAQLLRRIDGQPVDYTELQRIQDGDPESR
jgi:hypothetical protein